MVLGCICSRFRPAALPGSALAAQVPRDPGAVQDSLEPGPLPSLGGSDLIGGCAISVPSLATLMSLVPPLGTFSILEKHLRFLSTLSDDVMTGARFRVSKHRDFTALTQHVANAEEHKGVESHAGGHVYSWTCRTCTKDAKGTEVEKG